MCFPGSQDHVIIMRVEEKVVQKLMHDDRKSESKANISTNKYKNKT